MALTALDNAADAGRRRVASGVIDGLDPSEAPGILRGWEQTFVSDGARSEPADAVARYRRGRDVVSARGGWMRPRWLGDRPKSATRSTTSSAWTTSSGRSWTRRPSSVCA